MTENQCIKCGKSIPASAFFCENCKGNAVVSVQPTPSVKSKSVTNEIKEQPVPSATSTTMSSNWKGFHILLWILTLVGGVYGGLTLIVGLGSATSAPQQAAAAGMAVGYAVIPYCISRAFTEIINLSRQR